MAVFRQIQCNFWNDPDLVDAFTPEDRYFYLYLMTNEHTTQCGVYQVSLKQVAFETGYSPESVKALMSRFEMVHKRIRYNPETRELAVRNWLKHNGPVEGNVNVLKRVQSELADVQDRSLVAYVLSPLPAPYKGLISPFPKDEEEDEEEDEELGGSPAPLVEKEGAASEPDPHPPAAPRAARKSEEADPLYRAVWDSCLAMSGGQFSNYKREGEGCKRFCGMVRARSPTDSDRTAQEILELFRRLRDTGGKFWAGQPFTPSVLASSAIFDRIWTEHQRGAAATDTGWVDDLARRGA